MLSIHVMVVSCWLLSTAAAPPPGEISGAVVNAVTGEPVPDAPVVLRVALQNRFVPAQKTAADATGRFLLEGLPVGDGYLYVPGANAEGIHYPGPRVRLTSRRPKAEVRLEVSPAVAEPNPLVVRRHEIVLEPQPGALTVSETMHIENPTRTCYVGRAETEGAEPVTLRLSIPSHFRRTTFEKEFYGRRFSIAGGG
ncbi:MAG: hypothetical protein ACOC46_03225, partial [Pirellulales bacterium]